MVFVIRSASDLIVFALAVISSADSLPEAINPARLLDVEDHRGRITVGYAADIIGVDRNPLDDISALKEVSFVMKDGRVAKRPER